MKRILPILILLFATLQASAQEQNIRYSEANQKVVFTSGMNKASLDQLQKDLKEHAITLNYDELTFAPSGGLVGISFTVKDSSGRKFEAESDDVTTSGFFGFQFAWVDGKSTVLNVGTILTEP